MVLRLDGAFAAGRAFAHVLVLVIELALNAGMASSRSE